MAQLNSNVLNYECIRGHLESFEKSALEGLMEKVNLDDSYDHFIDDDDDSHSEKEICDKSHEEIAELMTENLGLKDKIRRYEAELIELVDRCNKCPQCSRAL